VVLLNPKNPRQKVASGKISDWWGLHKFHGAFLLEFWFTIDLQDVYVFDNPLMHSHEIDDHAFVQDVVGICAL
jgi:hypothetical protein